VIGQLQQLFGAEVRVSPLTTDDRMGRRVEGLDLSRKLSGTQAEMLIELVDRFQIVTFPSQDQHDFVVTHLERIANHFGAPIAHPNNYSNYGNRHVTPSLQPVERRTSTLVREAFPDSIKCMDGADSPAVYIVTNVPGGGRDKEELSAGGQHWHTDIEFEPVPLSTSMFYVQQVPRTRNSSLGTWVTNPPREPGFYHPDSSQELAKLREALPLNGETAYADTAAAYASLDESEQCELDTIMVRRRFRKSDDGWLIPLVRLNPRTGMKSLHSPVWASRGRRIAPAEIEGMSAEASRHFFDRLEAHCLQPQFRYDHVHTPGDVTIWSNFSTLHTAPPHKKVINDPKDARLMYRISCKGPPSYELPRHDDTDWLAANITAGYRSSLST